jgi:Uma2 family endonuclease
MNNLAYDYNDDVWEETLNGKIVAMSPRPATNHNIVSNNISNIFHNYLKGKPCKTFMDGIDVHMTEDDTVIPDALIVCERDKIKPDGIYGAPDLIVEVLSPGTAKRDKGYKKDLYERCGVKEYWIVDISNLSIEVYLINNGKYELDDVYLIYPDYLLKKMKREEKDAIAYEFKTSLFGDLTIKVKDVFDGMI